MSSFVVPHRVEICGGCGGSGRVGFGVKDQDCGKCDATGMLVDWLRVEEREMEEMINGGNNE